MPNRKENEKSMKKFYDTIADKYDYIFPLSSMQKKFLDEEVKSRKILDVGAGTGKVTKYLNEKGLQLTSIDLNERLIKKAAEKGILILNENMLNIDKFPNFDTIINIGNALPHLNSKKEIYEFLEKSYNQLNDDGKIIIQIINFVKFIKNKEKNKYKNNFLGNLPLIENEKVKFERAYYLNEENNIIFKTILDNKIENEEILLNIEYNELKNYFEKIGFKNIKIYGGFDKSEFDAENSMPLIMTGDKIE